MFASATYRCFARLPWILSVICVGFSWLYIALMTEPPYFYVNAPLSCNILLRLFQHGRWRKINVIKLNCDKFANLVDCYRNQCKSKFVKTVGLNSANTVYETFKWVSLLASTVLTESSAFNQSVFLLVALYSLLKCLLCLGSFVQQPHSDMNVKLQWCFLQVIY